MKRLDKNGIFSSSYTEPQKISLHLKICYVLEQDNRWHLHVVVDEMTTAEDLRESWGKIDQARQKLKDIQGSDPNWFSIALLSDMVKCKERSSYADLAMDLNFDSLVYMFWATDERRGENNQNAGLINFINLYQALGMNVKIIRIWEEQARESIRKGQLPWGVKKGPIDSKRIIDALKQFSKEKTSRKIVIKPTNEPDLITQIRITSLVYKYWGEAEERLKRFAPREYKYYEKQLSDRTSELLQRVREFSGLNIP
jgi:hypothetical protein